MNSILGIIRIGIDPDMISAGSLVITWHGFFTFIAVATAVLLVAWRANKEGISTDAVFSVAVWAILGGVVGARLLHVIDFWDQVYRHDVISVLYVQQGGIAVLGAVLGGTLSGAIYVTIRNRDGFISFWNKWFPRLGRLGKIDLPSVGRLADIVAPFLVLGMAIGRIGDIINGEHFARATSLPWGFVYSHIDTLGTRVPSHPAVVYEMIWDILVLGVVWGFRNRLRPNGMVFTLFLGLYSLGRFFISFLREDRIWMVGLDEAQIVTLIAMVVTMTILISKAQLVRPSLRTPTPAPAPVPEVTEES